MTRRAATTCLRLEGRFGRCRWRKHQSPGRPSIEGQGAASPILAIARSAVARFEERDKTARRKQGQDLSTRRAGLVSRLEAFCDDGRVRR